MNRCSCCCFFGASVSIPISSVTDADADARFRTRVSESVETRKSVPRRDTRFKASTQIFASVFLLAGCETGTILTPALRHCVGRCVSVLLPQFFAAKIVSDEGQWLSSKKISKSELEIFEKGPQRLGLLLLNFLDFFMRTNYILPKFYLTRLGTELSLVFMPTVSRLSLRRPLQS